MEQATRDSDNQWLKENISNAEYLVIKGDFHGIDYLVEDECMDAAVDYCISVYECADEFKNSTVFTWDELTELFYQDDLKLYGIQEMKKPSAQVTEDTYLSSPTLT